jgi:hypothetical protein
MKKEGANMFFFPLKSTIITTISNLIWMDSSFDTINVFLTLLFMRQCGRSLMSFSKGMSNLHFATVPRNME